MTPSVTAVRAITIMDLACFLLTCVVPFRLRECVPSGRPGSRSLAAVARWRRKASAALVAIWIASQCACSHQVHSSEQSNVYETRRDGLIRFIEGLYEKTNSLDHEAIVYIVLYRDNVPENPFWGPFISEGACGGGHIEKGECRYSITISDEAIWRGNVATLAEVIMAGNNDVRVNHYYIGWTSRDQWEVMYSAISSQ